jgi:acyl-coenzyme A synthetase/AMP-(fatty) acid ligase
MIKTGGVNVAPLEVDQVLLQHPDIVQAYVVGVPDQAEGEIAAAAVELRAGAAADTGSIMRSAASSWQVTKFRSSSLFERRHSSRARRRARSTNPP